MAAVVLETVWLNLAADPSVRMSFPMMSELNVATTQPGEVRTMANGRQRLVRVAGLSRAVSLTLAYCTPAQVAWLELHVGELMCVRDDRGRKLFAAYLQVPVDEHQSGGHSDVSLSLSEITHSEAV